MNIFDNYSTLQQMRREPQNGEEKLVVLGTGQGRDIRDLYSRLPTGPNQPPSQYLWAREIGSKTPTGYSGSGNPFEIIGGAPVSIGHDVNVWVEWVSVEKMWRLKRADLSYLTAINRSVHFDNPSDPHNQYQRLDNLLPLLSFPVGGMVVAVAGVRFTDKKGRNVDWKGTNDVSGDLHIDLTSYIPSTSGHRRYAEVYFDVERYHLGLHPIQVATSTSQTTALNQSDITECLVTMNALGTEYLESKAYRLDNGMTNLIGSPSRGDDQDRRPWLTGTGGLTAPASFGAQTANTVLAGPTTGSPAAPTFRAIVAADINPALLAPGPIGSTTPNTIAGTSGVFKVNDAATNSATTVFTFGHNTSGTPAAGYGTKYLFQGESSTTPDVDMASVRSVWGTATHASRVPNLIFSLFNSSGVETDMLTLTPTGAAVAGTLSVSGLSSLNGANIGYDPTAPNPAKTLNNFWVPRLNDINTLTMLDYQDDAAYWYKRATSVTATPSPSSGTLTTIFEDNASYIEYSSGTSPSPIVIEVNALTAPILAQGSGVYQVGLTFRSAGGATPTNIKIEAWDTSTSAYVSMYDAATTITDVYWLSPRFTAPASTGSTFALYKLKVTFTFTNPLAQRFRLQRLMVYHATGAWDPWHLHIGGGRVYGNSTFDGLIGFAAQTSPEVAVHVGTGVSALVPNGGGANVRATLQVTPTSGTAMATVAVMDGTNNRRIGLFADNTNGIVGLSWANTGGTAPSFMLRGSAEFVRITAAGLVGVGTFGAANPPTSQFHVLLSDTGTNATTTIATLTHNSSGVIAAGFGSAILFNGQSSTTAYTNMARFKVPWVTPTHASRVAKATISVWNVSTETDVADFTITGIESALDMKTTVSTKGPVLIDRGDGLPKRIVITNGVLSTEAV